MVRSGARMNMNRFPPPLSAPPLIVPFMNRRVYRHPFDIVLCETSFPRVKPGVYTTEESAFNTALLKRVQVLTPSPEDHSALLGVVTKIQSILDNIIISPGKTEVSIEEVRVVGSFKKATIMKGHTVADIVVIFKTLPTKESVVILSQRIIQDFKENNTTGIDIVQDVSMAPDSTGFDIITSQGTVRILISTVTANLKKLTAGLHLDANAMKLHMGAIRHSRWFDDNASHSSNKMLVRLLKDLRNRFSGLQCLNPWMIDLLAHRSLLNNKQTLPIQIAYRRVIQLLAGGLFLPGAAGIVDPCETGNLRVQTLLTLEQQDVLCTTAQHLVRIMAHGGFLSILNGNDNILKLKAVGGITLGELQKAYEKQQEMVEDDSAAVECEEVAMESA
ncbi:interleukin enhancer-binding factor 2 homolog [Adelges cooleyi]|uniref:interleukin enhancer-binding factor 2 homolog n=1 Tax=Adelges cooleyi TaxID=133065 RepID=UPI0021805C51|nr:interleukin enhancer-binding factor 2 homolog [Adelges cooleyi]XP_050434243.1 interleukin enhancer-binding factor 2 homolog [Adelges cooleyi]XP_050435630.1 interleukin enhancer-binding factor 2 homolog [Adelges cooleyi]XP_050435638.1 interleukin enhancer-binding factor 2 homolog [Adelges cooleyi]